MPRFLIYAPDYPDHLAERYAVRPEHLERNKSDPAGLVAYSGPIAPRIGTKQRDTEPPAGQLNLAGSFMVWNMDNIDQAWARVKEDVYWRAGVWDKERLIVEELLDI
ncbi:uncharacterized protein L201_007237 [Kwoniella dendrophila CBS 6074]|uniref:YCII-related domain-containing protein n=1 Tax=Kwoniella dendrophila CBS 6074 TaxID=1295534 RepID=A0AAX4K5C9_9TREE